MNSVVADNIGIEQINKIFLAQKENQYKVANTSVSERKKKLKALKNAVEVTYRQKIKDALKADFKKPSIEVDVSEIYPVVAEIKHAISHLSHWMSYQPVDTPISFLGSSSSIKYEPKGVCLIISPWNFPLNLTFSPLVSAIAAGNTAILKPSEFTPNISAVMAEIICEIFDENEVAVIQGGIETSTILLDLPFNHIFFTGAPAIGKVVMKAASKHLSSVTLELGGKSPTIIDETANLKSTARRIAFGKFLNSGQICIAPDYILVHESKKDAFITEMSKVLNEMYGNDAQKTSDYTRIVNEKHTQRIVGYIQDSVMSGAKVVYGGKSDVNDCYIQPTLVSDVPLDSALMQHEIFGPVLPIITYNSIEKAVEYIQSGEKPLALYVYSESKKNIDFVINNTRSGGTCINNNDIHFNNVNLPFGGSNNSGIGKSHGFFGFQAFSDARAIYRQHIPGALELLLPPYNNFKQKLIDLTIKYF